MNDRLVLRDIPYGLWVFEAFVILFGILFLNVPTFPVPILVLLFAGSLAGFAFTSILTVTTDRQTGQLVLELTALGVELVKAQLERINPVANG